MTISSTRAFNPDVADILEEAFEMAGLELRTGQDIVSGKRSLNLLLLEWHNKGIHLWTIDSVTIASSSVVAGTYEYDIDTDTITVLDVVCRTDAGSVTSQVDRTLTEISAVSYSQIANKLQRGQPTQFWINRTGVKNESGSTPRLSQLVLWPVPDTTDYYTIVYWRMKRMADAGSGATSTMEVPDRFLPALIAGLAYRIAKKRPAALARIGDLREDADRLLQEAMEEDRERQDLVIHPDISGYSPLND